MVVPVFRGTFISVKEGVIFYPLSYGRVCVHRRIEEVLSVRVFAKVGDYFLSFFGYEEFYESDGSLKVDVRVPSFVDGNGAIDVE